MPAVILDDQPTDLAYCDKCKSFLPKAIVAKSNYNHKCLGSEGWSNLNKYKGFAKFKSSNLESISTITKRILGLPVNHTSFKCKLCSKIFRDELYKNRSYRKTDSQ